MYFPFPYLARVKFLRPMPRLFFLRRPVPYADIFRGGNGDGKARRIEGTVPAAHSRSLVCLTRG